MNKAIVKTLTPVHVGSGKSFKHKIEFFSEGDYIYIIDSEKIFDKIGTNGIDEWVSAINMEVSVKDFLKARHLTYKPEDISLRKCALFNPIKKDKELHEQIYSPVYNCPFIPGSSIKGAMKTALLDYITDNKKVIEKERFKLSDIYREEIKNEKKRIKWFDEKTDSVLFGEDANHKSTRFLKTGDAYFKNVKTKVYFTQALNASENGWKLNANISNLYEAVPEEATAVFEMKLDDVLFARNLEKESEKWQKPQFEYLHKGLIAVAEQINRASIKALERELDFFKDVVPDKAGINYIKKCEDILEIAEKCKNNEFVLRVGANSGYNFTTLRWIDKLEIFQPLATNNNYALLRKEIQKNGNKKDYSRESLWPRTRKMITDGTPFGFIKITLLSDEEYEQYKKEMENIREQTTGEKIETSLISNKPQTRTAPGKTIQPPQPYTGNLSQGTGKIPAQVIRSGKTNIVKLLIKDNETELPLTGYASEIETGKYIYVRITQYSKGKIVSVYYESDIK